MDRVTLNQDLLPVIECSPVSIIPPVPQYSVIHLSSAPCSLSGCTALSNMLLRDGICTSGSKVFTKEVVDSCVI